MRTKQEAAAAAGLGVFDCALPQPWLDAVARTIGGADPEARGRTYEAVRSGTVWSYDGAHRVFGAPFPLTSEARRAIEEYDAATGSRYAEAWGRPAHTHQGESPAEPDGRELLERRGDG
jgi:hypothetical protein